MIQYAKEHEPSVQFDYGVVPCLIIHGRRWAYDHWEIETHTVGGKEYDRIDLCLVDITT